MPSYLYLQNIEQKPASVLSIGYPLVVFLLLALPSTSYARDVFLIVVLIYLWKDLKHFIEGSLLLIKNPLFLAGIVLIAYTTLSAFWSNPPLSHSISGQIRNGINVLMIWLCTCLYFYNDKNALKRLFWVISLGILANLIGAAITETNILFGSGKRLRGYGILINPIFVGSVAVIQITIGLNLKPSSLYEKIGTSTMLAVAIMVVSQTISRGPILALLAVLLIWVISTPNIKVHYKIAIGFTAALVALALTYTTNAVETLTARGVSKRPIIWQETISYAQQHLFFGWGWLNDFSQSVGRHELKSYTNQLILHPHNLLISSFFYGGIAGLLIHITFFGIALREAVKSHIPTLSYTLMAGLFLLTAADTYTTVTRRDFMLLIFWLPIAIIITTNLPTPNKKPT